MQVENASCFGPGLFASKGEVQVGGDWMTPEEALDSTLICSAISSNLSVKLEEAFVCYCSNLVCFATGCEAPTLLVIVDSRYETRPLIASLAFQNIE